MKHIALLLFFALSVQAQVFGPATRVRRGAGAPSSGECASAGDVGKVYVRQDWAAANYPIYACANNGVGTYAWLTASGGGGGTGDVSGGSGLNTVGAGLYVSSSSTVAQDANWTRVAAGQYKLYNATGPNTLTVRAGAGQSTTNLAEYRSNADAVLAAVGYLGNISGVSFINNAANLGIGSAAIGIGSAASLRFSSTTSWNGTVDVEAKRSSANNLAITNGSSTNYWGIGAGGIQCLSGDGDSAQCDFGVTGARGRDVNAARHITAGGNITGNNLASANVGAIFWSARSQMTSPADGQILLRTSGGTDFGLLQFGGTTASFPAIKRSTTELQAKLADDSAFTKIRSSGVIVDGATSTNCLLADGTTGACGGATASSSLTDFVLTRNSGTLATLAAGKYAYGNGPLLTHAGSTFSPVTLTVTGTTGNGVTPIVVTVSSLTGTSLQQGHTVHITGVGGNTAANGTHVVEVLDATHISLTGKTGNGTYTSGGVVAGTGSGTCPVYGTPQGYAQIDCPASTGLIMSCTGSCTMRQSPTSTIADDGTYFGDLVVVGGAWSSATDQRGWLNRGGAIQAGQGISTSVSGGTTTVNVDGTVARTTGNNSYTGANNFTLATRTAPHRASTGSPASRDNCTVGDTYFQTDATAGQNQWGCTATNTWTLQGGGGSSAPTPTSTTYLVDEFFQGGSSTAWGQLGWRGVATTGSGTTAAVAGTANHPGTLRLTTTSGNGDGLLIDLRGGSVNPIAALNGSGGVGFGMTTIFKTSSAVANERIEIGWFDAQADGANNMIGINFIPAVSHTKFQCTVMVSGTRTHVDSGVTPANSTWYAAKLNINSSGVLTCDINGTTSTTSATFPTSAMAPAIWIQNSTAAAQTLDVDWVAMAIPNGGR